MRKLVCLAGSVCMTLAGCGDHVSVKSTGLVMLPETGAALARPADYALVWQDEFYDGEQLVRDRWSFDTDRNRAGWYNGELQYYSDGRDENARLEGGRLLLEARVEDLSALGLADWGGQRYSSARLTTRGAAAWRHGFFEIRAKMPCARGIWPALWLHPEHQSGQWDGGEIDIAEVVGHEPHLVHHSVQTVEHNFRRGNHLGATTRIPACGRFHDYQLHWTKDHVVIGVDGRVSFSTVAEPFDRPMILIMNVAVGGDWAGKHGIDDSGFPQRMEIEWVRVWQKMGA